MKGADGQNAFRTPSRVPDSLPREFLRHSCKSAGQAPRALARNVHPNRGTKAKTPACAEACLMVCPKGFEPLAF